MNRLGLPCDGPRRLRAETGLGRFRHRAKTLVQEWNMARRSAFPLCRRVSHSVPAALHTWDHNMMCSQRLADRAMAQPSRHRYSVCMYIHTGGMRVGIKSKLRYDQESIFGNLRINGYISVKVPSLQKSLLCMSVDVTRIP